MQKNAKKKDFDCVEMKNKIQKDILVRYEKRKGEFNSLADFIKAECDESPWVQGIIEKIKKAQNSTKKTA